MLEIKLIIFHLMVFFLNSFISQKLGFFDKPNLRKIHSLNIVHTGGVCLYITYVFILFNFELNIFIENIIATGAIIIIFGFLDDQYKLSPGIKLFFIFLPVIYLIDQGLYLEDLGNYEIIGWINLNKFSLIFTFLSVGLLINSFNYIDGIDGLSILTSIITLTCFYFFSGNEGTKNLLYLLILPLIISLIFNFFPSTSKFKIFLGNAGSLFLGFLISFLMIYLYIAEFIHPSKLIWTVWLPIYDFLSVNINRLKNKVSIFTPSKDHVHHIFLLFFNYNALKATLLISLINIGVICTGILIAMTFGYIFSLISFIIFFVIYHFLRNFFQKIIL